MGGTTDLTERRSGQGTVLVVDDEPSVRRTVSRMLEYLGYTTMQAEDGCSAVDTYRANADHIALVMLDLTMPNMDGEQTFAELRRLQPEVRVVLMSGFIQSDVVTRFTGKEIACFLQKPFSFDMLRGALQTVME
jgi:DNA-binding NtrC family response regulator